jgi:hypothetical protein
MSNRLLLEDKLDTLNGYMRDISIAANAQLNGQIIGDFDGTKKTYDRLMKQWFLTHGVNAMASEGITSLCDQ